MVRDIKTRTCGLQLARQFRGTRRHLGSRRQLPALRSRRRRTRNRGLEDGRDGGRDHPRGGPGSPGLEGSNPYVFVAAGGCGVLFRERTPLEKRRNRLGDAALCRSRRGYPVPAREKGVALVDDERALRERRLEPHARGQLWRGRGVWSPRGSAAGGSRVFFTEPALRELWTSDGTASGTRVLRSFDSRRRFLVQRAAGSTSCLPGRLDGKRSLGQRRKRRRDPPARQHFRVRRLRRREFHGGSRARLLCRG